MMKTNSDTTPAFYIGLDVHKEQTAVAIADPGPSGEVRFHGSVATTQISLERLVRRIATSKRWHPLPGALLQFRFRFVATYRIRLGSGSGLSSAVLCVPSMGALQMGFESPVGIPEHENEETTI